MPLFKRNKETERPPAPFVVGMNRSGTTLLRMMLDSHPQLTIPPETHFVPDVIKACRRGDATPDAALRGQDAPDPVGAARGAVRARDPRWARRRALGAGPHGARGDNRRRRRQ